MVFASELPIGLLDLVLAGRARYTKSFVVVAELNGHAYRLYGDFKAFPGSDHAGMVLFAILDH